MGKSITGTAKPSSAAYEILEDMVRAKVQEFIQDILEEEITDFLARGKSERTKGIDSLADIATVTGKPGNLP